MLRKYFKTSRQERAFVAALRETLPPDITILTGYTKLPVYAIPDAYLPQLHLCIFVDGCYWHGCPEHGLQRKSKKMDPVAKRASDKAQTLALQRIGLNVLRLRECDLKGNIQHYADLIAAGIEEV